MAVSVVAHLIFLHATKQIPSLLVGFTIGKDRADLAVWCNRNN
jgi:hypothetical protein